MVTDVKFNKNHSSRSLNKTEAVVARIGSDLLTLIGLAPVEALVGAWQPPTLQRANQISYIFIKAFTPAPK